MKNLADMTWPEAKSLSYIRSDWLKAVSLRSSMDRQLYNSQNPPSLEKLLTVCISTYDDYDGVYFSIQNIKFNHPTLVNNISYLVLDQNPNSEYGKLTKLFCEQTNVRYVPFTDRIGPSHARNRAVELCETPFILSMDSHVLLQSGSLNKLIHFLHINRNTIDLYHGPLIYNDGVTVSTHWSPGWKPKAQNYGQWETDERGKNVNGDPFEIPFSGVGMMVFRKDAWPTYNKDFIGYGGEEWYIHSKFKNRGGRIYCLPFLRWMHRFGQMPHIKYPNHLWSVMYNHLLGAIELEDWEDVATQLKHWKSINEDELNKAIKELMSRGYSTSPPPSIAKKIVNAVKSTINTQLLNKNRTTDEQYAERLKVCESCPGNHATFRKGKLNTCGPMIKSLLDKKQKTCGCVLLLKARDSSESCPFGYWPTIKST